MSRMCRSSFSRCICRPELGCYPRMSVWLWAYCVSQERRLNLLGSVDPVSGCVSLLQRHPVLFPQVLVGQSCRTNVSCTSLEQASGLVPLTWVAPVVCVFLFQTWPLPGP